MVVSLNRLRLESAKRKRRINAKTRAKQRNGPSSEPSFNDDYTPFFSFLNAGRNLNDDFCSTRSATPANAERIAKLTILLNSRMRSPYSLDALFSKKRRFFAFLLKKAGNYSLTAVVSLAYMPLANWAAR